MTILFAMIPSLATLLGGAPTVDNIGGGIMFWLVTPTIFWTLIGTPLSSKLWGCEMMDGLKIVLISAIVWNVLWKIVLQSILNSFGLA